MPPKLNYQYLAFGYHATKNQLYELSLSSSSAVSVDFTCFKLIGKKNDKPGSNYELFDVIYIQYIGFEVKTSPTNCLIPISLPNGVVVLLGNF